LMLWLATQNLMKATRRAKAPTWRTNCRCLETAD
jgi:hypothetical protein